MKLTLASFLLFVSFVFSAWTIRKYDQKINPKGYFGVDFATYSKQIRTKVTCNAACDVFLLTKAEFDKLRSGNPFNYLAKGSSIFYEDTINIRKLCLLAVVNPSATNSINARITAEQYTVQNSNGGIIGGGVTVGIGGGGVCLCILLCIGIAICFGRRNRSGYVDIHSSNYNAGYYANDNYSTGGNTYSGTIGGGGNNTNYSTGGNTYSGTIGGGNQYGGSTTYSSGGNTYSGSSSNNYSSGANTYGGTIGGSNNYSSGGNTYSGQI
eukprot:gene4004-7260_t